MSRFPSRYCSLKSIVADGTFSNVHGSAASNVLSARVVLANGSLVTANATENPDLYWSLKGGGGGLGGVVTEWTARTYPAPTHTVRAGVNAFAADAKALEVLLEQLLITAHRFTSSSPFWGSVGVNAKRLPGGQGFNAGISAQGWELSQTDAAPLLAPLLKWIEEEKPVNISRAEEHHGGWTLSEWQPSDGATNMPWIEAPPGGDNELSTMMLRSPCRLVPDATDDERAKHNAAALALVTQQLPELSHSHNSTQMATQFNWGIDVRYFLDLCVALSVSLTLF